MFTTKKSKAQPKLTAANGDDEPEDLAPIDLLVDVLIGFMERSSAQLRSLATQVFAMLSAEVSESTIDLLLAVCLSSCFHSGYRKTRLMCCFCPFLHAIATRGATSHC